MKSLLLLALGLVRTVILGVRIETVPWARHNLRFTRDFEDWAAWLAVRCTVSELARVE